MEAGRSWFLKSNFIKPDPRSDWSLYRQFKNGLSRFVSFNWKISHPFDFTAFLQILDVLKTSPSRFSVDVTAYVLCTMLCIAHAFRCGEICNKNEKVMEEGSLVLGDLDFWYSTADSASIDPLYDDTIRGITGHPRI